MLLRISSPQSFCSNVVVQILLIKVDSLISDALCCDYECPFLHSKITNLLLIFEYSVMTSNSLAETSNHIQYNPTTYAKGKYAYVFQVHPAKLI